jgi:hypothetical protein
MHSDCQLMMFYRYFFTTDTCFTSATGWHVPFRIWELIANVTKYTQLKKNTPSGKTGAFVFTVVAIRCTDKMTTLPNGVDSRPGNPRD